MYLVEDRVSPAISTYVSNLRAKNKILLHFPKEMDGTDEVFGKLLYYNGTINESPSYLEVYKVFNIKVKDLKAESYEGIDNAWITFKQVIDNYNITTTQIGNYIDDVMPLTKDTSDPVDGINDETEWFDFSLNYNPATLNIPATVTDAELVAMAEAGHSDIWFGDEDEERIIALALLDTEDVMFEKVFAVTGRTIEKRTVTQTTHSLVYTNTTSNYVANATINLHVRRVTKVTDPIVDTYLESVQTKVAAIDDYTELTEVPNGGTTLPNDSALSISRFTAINSQLLAMYEAVVPVIESSLNSVTGKIKVEGFRSLTAKGASDFMRAQLDTGFQKKKVKFWKKALNFIIQIVTLVIAALTALPSGGSSLVAWAAWAGTVSFVLTIGMAAQAALAMGFSKHGDVNAAAMVGGSMKYLGGIATVFGIIGMFASVAAAAAKEVAKTAAKGVIIEGAKAQLATITLDSVFSAIKNMVVGGVKTSTTKMMQMGMKVVSVGLEMYKEYIDPLPEQLDEMKSELAAQERELEDTTSADTSRQVHRFLDNPYANQYDMNEYMQNIPYIMTEGKNKALMTKYYS